MGPEDDEQRAARLSSALLGATRRAVERAQWDEAEQLLDQLLEVVPDLPDGPSLRAAIQGRGNHLLTEQGRRFVTVLFSDMVGSTALSERLDVEDYVTVVEAYREVVRRALHRHGGQLDQFQGDGVIAYFGVPLAAEDDQLRAVEAAFDIVREVPEAGRSVGIDLAARVGVHVGRTVLSTSDLGLRDQATVLGFAANVAARLQSLADPGGVVVSAAVVDAIAPYFGTEPIDAGELRGVSGDIRAHLVTGPRARTTLQGARWATPMVDRTPERARIEAAWQAASGVGEASQVVTIVGEPGLGKSRLARFALDLAQSAGGGFLEVSCGRGMRHMGLGAVRRSIEKALLPDGGAIDAYVAELRQRTTLLALSDRTSMVLEWLVRDISPEGAMAELTPDRRREAVIGALLEWITAEAAAAPLALVVEDLQWADDIATETVRRLTVRTPPPGLFLLATARTDEMPDPLKPLLRDALELGPFDEASTRELVRAVSADGALDGAVVDALARRSEGVPLYAEQLAIAELTGPDLPDAGSTIPGSLEGLLQVRIGGSGPGRGLAEVAAVIGRDFDLTVVEEVLEQLGSRAPVTVSALPAALRSLERAGLVEHEETGRGRFRHALLRDAAYEIQVRGERTERHRAVARALVALKGDDADQATLGYHLVHAGELEPAAAAYLRAARHATELAAWNLSLEHLASAAGLIPRLDPGLDAWRLELDHCMQLGAVEAAKLGFAREHSDDVYHRALELCDLIGEADSGATLDTQVVAALGGIWTTHMIGGDHNAAGAIQDRLDRIIEETDAVDPEARRFVLGCRGFHRGYTGAYDEAVEVMLEAVSLLPDDAPVTTAIGTPHDHVAATLDMLSCVYAAVGDDGAGDEMRARALARMELLPAAMRGVTGGMGFSGQAMANLVRREWDAAVECCDALVELGVTEGLTELELLGQAHGAAARAGQGDPDACVLLRGALEMWAAAGGGLGVPLLLTELAQYLLPLGDLEGSRQMLDLVEAMMLDKGQKGAWVGMLRARAILDLAEGAPTAQVLDQLLAAIELGLETGAIRVAGYALIDALALPDVPPGALDDVSARLAARISSSARGDLGVLRERLTAG